MSPPPYEPVHLAQGRDVFDLADSLLLVMAPATWGKGDVTTLADRCLELAAAMRQRRQRPIIYEATQRPIGTLTLLGDGQWTATVYLTPGATLATFGPSPSRQALTDQVYRAYERAVDDARKAAAR